MQSYLFFKQLNFKENNLYEEFWVISQHNLKTNLGETKYPVEWQELSADGVGWSPSMQT